MPMISIQEKVYTLTKILFSALNIKERGGKRKFTWTRVEFMSRKITANFLIIFFFSF